MPHAAVNRTHTRVCECECGNLFITFIITPRWARAFIDLLVCIVYAYFIFISISLFGLSSLLTHLLIAFTIHTQFAFETTYTIFSYFAAEHIEMQQHSGRK